MRSAIMGIVIFAAGIGHCNAAQTIVGKWALSGRTCDRMPDLVIEPMAMTADEMRCDFRDVSRFGDLVIWHGECSDGAVSSKTTVRAKLIGRKLTVSFDNGDVTYYEKCK